MPAVALLVLACMLVVPAAHAATTTTAVAADTWVSQSSPDSSGARSQSLHVDGGTNAARSAYLQFRVAGTTGRVVRARIRVYFVHPTTDAPQVRRAFGAWPKLLLWGSRPRTGGVLADSAAHRRGWYEYDVTRSVTGSGTYAFSLSTRGTRASEIGAREGHRGAQLVITTSPKRLDDGSGEAANGEHGPATAPTAAAAGAISSTSVTVAWAAPTDMRGAAAYVITRDDAASSVAVIEPTSTVFVDEGLEPGTTHTYVIRVQYADGSMGAPTSITVTTLPAPDTTAPTAPTGAAATPLGASSIVVSWSASTDAVGVVSYLVYRAGANGPVATVAAAARTFTDLGLAPATWYAYYVRARDAAGNVGPATVTVTAQTQAQLDTTPPSAPATASASATGATTIEVSWTAATDDAAVTDYLIYRDGSPTAVATVGGSLRTWTDNGRNPSTAYTYFMRARDAAGNLGASTASVGATTSAPTDTTAPTAPPAVTAIATGATTINIGWSSATDDVGVVSYSIYRDGAPVPVVTAGPSVRTWTDIGRVADTTYSYVIRANDAAGNSSVGSTAAQAHTQTVASTGARLPVQYDINSITGTKYFVSTSGNNAAAGTLAAPLATLSAALAKVAVGATATIIVRGGTYHEGHMSMSSGRAIRVVAYPGEVPTFTGAADLDSGWITEGPYQYHAYTAQPVTNGSGIDFINGQNLKGDFVGKMPDQAWVGAQALQQVTNKTSLAAGKFWVDAPNNRIYLMQSDVVRGDVDASSIDWGLTIGGAGDAVEGIRLIRFSPSADDYGMLRVTSAANDMTVRDVVIEGSSFQAVSVQGGSTLATILQNPTFDHITITDSNWMGIASTLVDGMVVAHSVISDSNPFDEFAPGPQSGVIKTSRNQHARVLYNIFDNNRSHGLWFDQSNYDMDVIGNRITNTTGMSMVSEISADVLYMDNYVKTSANMAAVLLASTSGIKLVNNTIIGGSSPIVVVADTRSKPECITPQVTCIAELGSDTDNVRPRPYRLTWIPSLDLSLNNILGYPVGSYHCTGGTAAFCMSGTAYGDATVNVPISDFLHVADPAHGIPQTRIDGNVYAGGAGALIRVNGTPFTSTAAFTSAMAAAPPAIPDIDTGARGGNSWVNADGSPTAALTAVDAQAVPIPVDAELNQYLAAGDRHYGCICN